MNGRRLGPAFTLVAVVALALALGPLSAGPARTATPDATGWWARTQVAPTLPGAVPVAAPAQPTFVPEGGLYVGGDPAGATAVSAVRLELANGATATGDVVIPVERAVGTVNVEACPVVVVWAAERGGRLENAPPAVCEEGRVPASVQATATGDVLRVPVASFVRDGRVNLLLRPVAGSVFQLTTKPPGAGSVTVAEAPPASSSEPASEPSAFEPVVLGDGTAVGAFETFSPLGPLPSEPDPTASPIPAPQPTGLVAGPRPQAAPPLAAPVRSLAESRIRFIAALIAFDLAALYLWLLRSPGRLPRLLGPFGGGAAPAVMSAVGPARGIGRFARSRTAPPVRL